VETDLSPHWRGQGQAGAGQRQAIPFWVIGTGVATLLALVWDDLAPAIAVNYDKINLLKSLGPQGGLLATYVMLGLSLALVIWWEKHFFAQKARQNAAPAKRQNAL